MNGCNRCENLPPDLPEAGLLYVAPPTAYTRGRLRRLFWESGLPFGDPAGDVLAVEVVPEGLRGLSSLLSDGLSEIELRGCKAVLIEKSATFGLGMLSRMQDLATLTATVSGGWLLDMMREDRLTVHFQPIVPAADPDAVFAYECLLRGLDGEGSLVSPGPMFETARDAGLLFNLDRVARMKAIGEASGLGLESNIFVNFNPTSIYEPASCLRSTMTAIEESGISHSRIVFEVTESEHVRNDGHLRSILDFYRKSGCRIALDDLGAGYGSLNLLAALRPDFVKLDAGLIRDVDQDPYRAAIASKILELAKDLRVTVIAEGVETEQQWRWLLDNGADFVQGFFFARPAFPPPLPNYSNTLARNPDTTHA